MALPTPTASAVPPGMTPFVSEESVATPDVALDNKKAPGTAIRVMAPYGYPIWVHTQNIMVHVGVDVVVEKDAWVSAQLEAGTLREV